MAPIMLKTNIRKCQLYIIYNGRRKPKTGFPARRPIRRDAFFLSSRMANSVGICALVLSCITFALAIVETAIPYWVYGSVGNRWHSFGLWMECGSNGLGGSSCLSFSQGLCFTLYMKIIWRAFATSVGSDKPYVQSNLGLHWSRNSQKKMTTKLNS